MFTNAVKRFKLYDTEVQSSTVCVQKDEAEALSLSLSLSRGDEAKARNESAPRLPWPFYSDGFAGVSKALQLIFSSLRKKSKRIPLKSCKIFRLAKPSPLLFHSQRP